MKTWKDEEKASLLQALADTLDCAPLLFDDKGRIVLDVDDDMEAVLFNDNDEESGRSALVLCVLIGQPDDTDAEKLYSLLTGNYLWGYTGGASLAIDKETGILVLQKAFFPGTDPEDFMHDLSQVIGAARYWRSRVQASSFLQHLSSEPCLLRV